MGSGPLKDDMHEWAVTAPVTTPKESNLSRQKRATRDFLLSLS